MSHVLVIAARELRERNRIFLAAAVFAVLPFLTSLLPGVAKTMGRPVLIALAGGLLAVAVALGTAVALGASIVGRELTEKRLSFFFARPVSAAAIWWGKAIAGIVASLSAFGIIIVPSLLVGLDVWKTTWTMQPKQLVPFTMICAIVLFLVSHAVSTMIRSRSALLALDVLLLGATLFVLYLIAQPLIVGIAAKLLAWLGLAIVSAIFVVLAVVPVWQLDRGRTDRVRSHAALSLYLWSSVGVIVLLTGAFVLWVASASPADLKLGTMGIEQSPYGGSVVLYGNARNRLDYHAAFVIGPEGRARRISAPPWWPIEFARGGEVIAWRSLAPLARSGEAELMLLRSGERQATGIRLSQRGSFVLSDDASRVVVLDGPNLAVHDVSAQRLLFSSRARGGTRRGAAFFMTPNVLRIVERQSSQPDGAEVVRLLDLDLGTRAITTRGEFKAETKSVGFSPDGRYMLIRGGGHVVDTQSGRVIRTITTPTAYQRWSVVLNDGTVVARRRDGDNLVLDIFRPDGQTIVPILKDAKSYVAIEGEIAPGKLLISIGRGWHNDPPHLIKRAVAVLDVQQGVITNRVENASVGGSWRSDPRLNRIDPTNIAALDGEGKAVRVNVLTGERRALVRE